MSRILVVDDESEMILILKKYLRKNGFTVFGANSGLKALEILEKNKNIDLMILDMKMPGIRGIDVLEKLKNKQMVLPVIVLTGSLNFSGFIDRMEKLGYSPEDVLFKPVALQELLNKICSKIEDLKKTADETRENGSD